MDLTGRVIAILPEQRFNGRNGEVVKNGFVVETGGQYPRKCVFSVIGSDRWAEFGLAVGMDVQVFFDINAREWNEKWFNDISAYRVQVVSANGAGMPQQPTHESASAPSEAASTQEASGGKQEDFPF